MAYRTITKLGSMQFEPFFTTSSQLMGLGVGRRGIRILGRGGVGYWLKGWRVGIARGCGLLLSHLLLDHNSGGCLLLLHPYHSRLPSSSFPWGAATAAATNTAYDDHNQWSCRGTCYYSYCGCRIWESGRGESEWEIERNRKRRRKRGSARDENDLKYNV